MKWSEFYSNYDEWADSTRKNRISSLENIVSGKEVVTVTLDIEDPKVRAQLINKAMKFGVVFTREDFADLDGELSAQQYEILGKYAGFDHTDPHFDENHMTWNDFYFGHTEWDKEKLVRRIRKLRRFGPADEVCTVACEMEDPMLRWQLVSKALEHKVIFTQENFAELHEKLPQEQYEKLGKKYGFDYNDPYFDEDNMTWDDFYYAYSDWDEWLLARRIQKLTEFGPADEVCEVVPQMPTLALEDALYKKAVAAGVRFTNAQKEEMGIWEELLPEYFKKATDALSDENIKNFVDKATQIVEEAEQIVANEEKNIRKAKRENRRMITLAAILGIFSGIEEEYQKKKRKR